MALVEQLELDFDLPPLMEDWSNVIYPDAEHEWQEDIDNDSR